MRILLSAILLTAFSFFAVLPTLHATCNAGQDTTKVQEIEMHDCCDEAMPSQQEMPNTDQDDCCTNGCTCFFATVRTDTVPQLSVVPQFVYQAITHRFDQQRDVIELVTTEFDPPPQFIL